MFLNLKALLSLNASGFHIGMKQAASAGKSLSRELKAEFARAFGVATIVAFSKKIIDTADNIVDLSERLGISAKALQEWGYAAKKNGSDLEAVTRFFESLATNRQNAIDGNEGAIASFQKLGVTLHQLRNARLEDIGKTIGNALKGGDSQNLMAALRDVGGRGAGELIPAFKAGLDDMAAAAQRAGQIMSNETLVALKALKNEAQALADVFTGPVANVLTFISRRMQDLGTLMDMIVGGPAAFFGALAGGASFRDAVQAQEDHESTVLKEWEARRNKLAAAANQLGQQGASTPQTSSKITGDRIHNLGMRVMGENQRPEGLTEWQRLGAAVRQEATVPVLKSIADNTQKTAERIEALTKLFPKSGESFGIGGGF